MIKQTKDMKALEVFNNVCEETIEIILEQGEIRKYSKDTIIFYDKEDVSDIYIVISGTVALYKLNENGQKKVIFILGEGKVVNEVIIKELPASINCRAFENAELLKINKDVKAWITIDDTHIDYPVVQGKTNQEYLNKDVYGEFSLSGAIFLDYRNSPDFSDRYSLLYGHHMQNGAMFGDVVEFVNEDYFANHDTGTLYLPDITYKITLFACVETQEFDSIIYNPTGQNKENLDVLLGYIKDKATQYRSIEFGAEDLIIGMSTCAEAATNGRVILFGRLDELNQIKDGGKSN